MWSSTSQASWCSITKVLSSAKTWVKQQRLHQYWRSSRRLTVATRLDQETSPLWTVARCECLETMLEQSSDNLKRKKTAWVGGQSREQPVQGVSIVVTSRLRYDPMMSSSSSTAWACGPVVPRRCSPWRSIKIAGDSSLQLRGATHKI